MTREEFQVLIADLTEAELIMVYDWLSSLIQKREFPPLPGEKDQQPHQTEP